MWKETKLMRISREPSPIQVMMDQELKNVEYFNCFFSMTINDARCTRKIKSKTVMAKAAFNRKKSLFSRKLDLKI